LSISGDVYGYLQLPINIDCTDPNIFTTITNAGIQAAQGAGIDLSSYQSYVFVGSQGTGPAICPTRLGTVGGNPGITLDTLLNAASLLGVTAHELGHNLGLNHSHSINCGSVPYNPNTTCSVLEYGDLFDVMGYGSVYASPPHYNAVSKEFLGWVSPTTITATGIYSIAPWETASGSLPVALKIIPQSANDSFYMEYRQPIGFDSNFTSLGNTYTQPYNGILLHVPLANSYKEILNMSTSSYSSIGPTMPALTPGNQYVDYANRFSMTTISTSATSVQLRILVPPLNSPTLMIVSPANHATVSGSTTVFVDALDRTGVTKVEFYKDGTLMGTQTAVPYQFTWNASTETAGSHTLSAMAYNAAGFTSSQTITVNVISAPTVALTSPLTGASYQTGANVSIQTLIQDPGHVAQTVNVAINGQALCSNSITTNCSVTFLNAAAGSYQVTAQLLDAQNNVIATAVPVHFTVSGAATPLTVQMLNPTANAMLSEGVNVPLSAEVGGSLPSSVSVLFMVNGSAIGVGSSEDGSVFNLTWPNPQSGTYNLTAQVVASGGAEAVSAPLPVTVQPTIAFGNLSGTLTVDSVISVELAIPMASIQWVISPSDDTFAASAATPSTHSVFPAPNAIYQTTTTSAQLNLASAGLVPGHYHLAVAATDMHGQTTLPAEADIVLVGADVATANVYPNPWRADQDANPSMTFANLSGNTTIKIFTLSGRWVKTLMASSSNTSWDLTNDANERVASGIYFYLITNDQGEKIRGKLGIIR